MDVEVRIRDAGEAKSTHLTTWPIKDLEGLIREVRQWGVLLDGGDVWFDIVGQFVVSPSESYFELITGDDD